MLFTIYIFPFLIFLMVISLRLRKMHLSIKRKAMLTSSLLFGTNHFKRSLQQSMDSPKLDTILIVLMEQSTISFQQSSYSQQIMKNSMAGYMCYDLI